MLEDKQETVVHRQAVIFQEALNIEDAILEQTSALGRVEEPMDALQARDANREAKSQSQSQAIRRAQTIRPPGVSPANPDPKYQASGSRPDSGIQNTRPPLAQPPEPPQPRPRQRGPRTMQRCAPPAPRAAETQQIAQHTQQCFCCNSWQRAATGADGLIEVTSENAVSCY
ncbi:unnamed protein product [Prorocentrum cordatum]|uniref:t-SNARE coiled-coil homology domain-containing protein n=1 Tax=Prorocentrum cordatum TaxID=2364126 RepID=A0ABN9WL77_9DINO|nr:unnamed protein product [Polarella glacialis]